MNTAPQIIPLPAWTLSVRIAQFVLAFLILIFVAVPTSIWGGYGSFGFGIYDCIATFIITAYWYVANRRNPQYYNRWALLALDVCGVVWWLGCFSSLAEVSAVYGSVDDLADFPDGVSGDVDTTNFFRDAQISQAMTGAAAALGAVEFILFLVTLITFSTRLHKARRAAAQPVYNHGNMQPPSNYAEMKPFPEDRPELARPGRAGGSAV